MGRSPRRRCLRFAALLLAAALGLPALAPPTSAALAAQPPAVDAIPEPLPVFAAVGSFVAERGPGRHDEGRRLDATLAPAKLTPGRPLRAGAQPRFVACPHDATSESDLARWCLAHSTATAAP